VTSSAVDQLGVSGAAPDARPAARRPLLVVIATLVVAALVAASVALGYAWGNSGTTSSAPSATSVDAGFARDMSTHHQQAITMASYTRDNTSDPAIKLLAFDIESGQTFQVGEMQGWLDVWGLSRQSTDPMAWMAGHAHLQTDGLMPGMATPAQISMLQTLRGKALDVLFLQLMIHHHQGGLTMAQYAQQHAQFGYVRDLAQSMINAQSGEIVQMEQLLRSLGATALPAPSN
jgi:uncharacterized protein (DUF305 family)